MALSILPHLLTTSAKKNNVKNEIVILTATSGDTGKAALAGFANVPGTKIIVFYPKNGVSPIQEKQMVTQKGDNTYVIGIKGNFDDAQTGVKNIFSDKELEKVMNDAGFQFSSANSINIGRLVPQIVYYVYAYAKLLANGEIKDGEKINVVVPTGNFGNILAAFYAKNMGLPINKFICASNENKVLYDFFATGEYDRNREFVLTTSPSMDILISSNLERLIYRIAGNNAAKNAELMASLKSEGKYKITDDMKAQLADFYGNYATEAEDAATIKKIYEDCGYVIDTHTSVAATVYDKYRKETGDTTKTVIASTASPYKFTRSVMNAIDSKYDSMGDFELVDELSKISNVKVPNAIEEIRTAPVLHDTVCDSDKMCDEVKKILESNENIKISGLCNNGPEIFCLSVNNYSLTAKFKPSLIKYRKIIGCYIFVKRIRHIYFIFGRIKSNHNKAVFHTGPDNKLTILSNPYRRTIISGLHIHSCPDNNRLPVLNILAELIN